MDTKHYLRLLRTFALATLTAAAVAACSDDTDNDREPLTPPDGNGGIPVTFSANINPGSDAAPAAAPGTRTILEPTTEGGFTVKWNGKDNNPTSGYDLIHIWAALGNTLENNGSTKLYVPTTSAASSALEPQNESNKLTLSSAGEWTFTAIYGVSSSEIGGVNVSISPLMQSAPGKTYHIASRDFSVATTTKHVETGDMPDIGLQFKHKLSALQLHVTNQTGEALTVREIRFAVTGDKITTYKKYNVATGDWKAEGEEKSDYLKLIADNFPALATGGASQDLYMLFFPGYANTDMIITVITDRGEFTLTKKAPASPGFQAGKNYMTNIAIKTSGLTDKETWRETIRTPEQLAAFCERVNGGTDNYQGKTIYLADNIDLANASWTPIGNSTNNFKGTFDGGGYHINGLNVDNGSKDFAGLFGYIRDGSVRNLRVSGNVTTTGNDAGGIVGFFSSSGIIENCIFSGEVSGQQYVGGIAGYCYGNYRIAGCHTKGRVTAAANNAGGIAGDNSNNCTLTDCYSEAEVKGATTVGGIVGANFGSITRCYATGKVSGQEAVGGILGYEGKGTSACIALNPDLKRTGGDKTTFGRIVGFNNNGTVDNCGAFKDMRFIDATNSQTFDNHTGTDGTNLNGIDGVTKSIYTLDYSFTEATATTPGWAFDTATPWAYLPWNPAFEKFSGIQPADYCISVPYHITSTL